jgi:hypothetical protein
MSQPVTNNSTKIGGNSIGVVATNASNATITSTVASASINAPSSDVSCKSIDELLLALRNAIQRDTVLPAEDKDDLLKQLAALEKARQLPDSEEKKGIVRTARKIFDSTLKALPATAAIAESCGKLLPLVLKMIG